MKNYINQLWKLGYIMDNEYTHHSLSSSRILKEQVTSDNPFTDRSIFVQLLKFHNGCGYIKKLSRKGKGLSSPKGISKNEAGLKGQGTQKYLFH